MTRRLISTGSPFEKQAGYSRAVVQGPWVFVAGTTGYDYATMIMPEDVEQQARKCFETIKAALQDAGSDLSDVVRVRYIVSHRSFADAVFKIAGLYLSEIRPAATLIVAGLLQEVMKVEIEVTALKV